MKWANFRQFPDLYEQALPSFHKKVEIKNMYCNRRSFFKIGAQAAVSSLFPISAIASIDHFLASKRRLSFYNVHTDERLEVCYYNQGRYQPRALRKINYIFRDHYSGEIKSIHKDLIDFLYTISKAIGHSVPFHIISGYRSPETNAMLRKKTSSVAKNSLHMQGKAADDLRKLVTDGLVEAGLTYAGAAAFHTPRRLALARAGLLGREWTGLPRRAAGRDGAGDDGQEGDDQ